LLLPPTSLSSLSPTRVTHSRVVRVRCACCGVEGESACRINFFKSWRSSQLSSFCQIWIMLLRENAEQPTHFATPRTASLSHTASISTMAAMQASPLVGRTVRSRVVLQQYARKPGYIWFFFKSRLGRLRRHPSKMLSAVVAPRKARGVGVARERQLLVSGRRV
jgi:hypothetical protein